MIAIWDNGGSHEDHEIFFIDVGNAPPLDVEAAFALAPPIEGDRPHLVALVPYAKWLAPRPPVNLETFIEHARRSPVTGNWVAAMRALQ